MKPFLRSLFQSVQCINWCWSSECDDVGVMRWSVDPLMTVLETVSMILLTRWRCWCDDMLITLRWACWCVEVFKLGVGRVSDDRRGDGGTIVRLKPKSLPGKSRET
jgi:hypothetical protein